MQTITGPMPSLCPPMATPMAASPLDGPSLRPKPNERGCCVMTVSTGADDLDDGDDLDDLDGGDATPYYLGCFDCRREVRDELSEMFMVTNDVWLTAAETQAPRQAIRPPGRAAPRTSAASSTCISCASAAWSPASAGNSPASTSTQQRSSTGTSPDCPATCVPIGYSPGSTPTASPTGSTPPPARTQPSSGIRYGRAIPASSGASAHAACAAGSSGTSPTGLPVPHRASKEFGRWTQAQADGLWLLGQWLR